MSNENRETSKNNKKYIILALIIILAAIGIMKNNQNVDENQVVTSAPATIDEESTVARIDITTPLVDADKPQFEVYVDSSKTPEKQADWMPKFGIQGYVVQRNGKSLNLEIKALRNTEIKLVLRGPDKRDENNNFMPIWVDYSSVAVNGKEILPETTAAWHNKTFTYSIKAKASDKIKVTAKWQKHIEK